MKKSIAAVLFCIITFSLYGQIKNVDEYREKKILFYSEKDFNKTVNSIDKELSLLESHKSDYSYELYLTLQNMLYVDKLFFSLENEKIPDSKKGYFSSIFLSQEKKCESFIGEEDFCNFSSNFLLSVGDLKCQMPYIIQITKAIPKLTKAKEFYENAVINDQKNSAALISKALWFFHSPGIAGGSKKKAYKIIQEAEKAAKTYYDKYFVYIFKGQIEYSLKEKERALETFNEAHNLYPDEIFTDIIKENIK